MNNAANTSLPVVAKGMRTPLADDPVRGAAPGHEDDLVPGAAVPGDRGLVASGEPEDARSVTGELMLMDIRPA